MKKFLYTFYTLTNPRYGKRRISKKGQQGQGAENVQRREARCQTGQEGGLIATFFHWVHSSCMEERELVELARKDPDAFGVLFDRYYSPLLNYVVRRVGDVTLAQDLTSETFFKAYQKLWQFRFRGIGFSSWLYRIATNEIRMYYRGKRALSLEVLMESSGLDVPDGVNLEAELVAAEEELERHHEFLKVQKSLLELPLIYQEVIALRFFEEKKLAEIAVILGKREGTVKSLLSRGLKMLRDLWGCNLSESHAL